MQIRNFHLIVPVLIFFFLSMPNLSLGIENEGASASGENEIIATSEDSLIFSQLVEKAKADGVQKLPLSEVIVRVGQFFYDEPYVPHTLEVGETERLVVNLREFDCTTYVENVLALSYSFKSGNFDFQDYINRLRTIRYRHGKINGYPSRLHYFSEWLMDNQTKGLVKVISNKIGDGEFDSFVDFMSANAEKYNRLSGNTQFISAIKKVEQRISEYDWKYISAEYLDEISADIQNGDIIAFCSSIEGLDITHTGLACEHTMDGWYFMHASTNGQKVKLSEISLKAYIQGRSNVYGILIGRPVIPD